MTPEKQQELAEFVAAHPELSYAAIGRIFGITDACVWRNLKPSGIKRKRGSGSLAHPYYGDTERMATVRSLRKFASTKAGL